MRSINPATEEILKEYCEDGPEEIEAALRSASEGFRQWRELPFAERSSRMKAAAARLRMQKSDLSAVITAEMGKPVVESEAEVEKCAWVCDYYAEHAERFLADDPRETNACESFVEFVPLGVVLAVMPWNFPFWQVFRFAAPALMAGNTAILKHASNVSGCALAIEDVFRKAGFPGGTFKALIVPGAAVTSIIQDRRIVAVTLTGSEPAGAQVAAEAGRVLKKCVLELGGSDPFIVLRDADVAAAAQTAVRARFLNAGQSCIAAKRFIVDGAIFEEFQQLFVEGVRNLKVGDPCEPTTQVGPLARADLRDELDRQVQQSAAAGARVLAGGLRRPGRGYFYEPTVLADVHSGMPVCREEVFGPVAALLRVSGTEEAINVANDTSFGLGASLWTKDLRFAKQLARTIESGQVFINGMVVSDPRLPFGGVKRSGFGRELSEFGIHEFVNIQTVWIGPAR